MFIENTEELAQNKLLLLYIIKSSPAPFTNTSLTELILEKNYMNYFSLQQYLSDLLNSSLIHLIEEEGSKYEITEKGMQTLNYFQERIPVEIKEELGQIFQQKIIEQKRETQVVSDYYKNEEDQYVVNLKLIENEDTLFSLYLNVASSEQAELISKQWKNNTELIYKKIINLFIEE